MDDLYFYVTEKFPKVYSQRLDEYIEKRRFFKKFKRDNI
jgi:hypothetical protein